MGCPVRLIHPIQAPALERKRIGAAGSPGENPNDTPARYHATSASPSAAPRTLVRAGANAPSTAMLNPCPILYPRAGSRCAVGPMPPALSAPPPPTALETRAGPSRRDAPTD